MKKIENKITNRELMKMIRQAKKEGKRVERHGDIYGFEAVYYVDKLKFKKVCDFEWKQV